MPNEAPAHWLNQFVERIKLRRWWNCYWRTMLTLLSGGILPGSFVARDEILSGTQEDLHKLDAAATMLSVETDLSGINLGVLTAVNILSHPTTQQCTSRVANQIKTLRDGKARGYLRSVDICGYPARPRHSQRHGPRDA